MTSALGVSGRKPESRESRILGGITSESYDYRDQAKFMIKVAGDVSYLSAYMRKMQRGIDAANENFIQQIQSLINDLLVLFAGNGDTGFDFGDIKYIFQALGALFGFGDSVFPINLFQAAWHFFSTYILPINNFEEVINLIIDGAIATILDVFGEIPIVGQALQQLAVFISNIRDSVFWVFEAIGNVIKTLFGDFWQTEDFFDDVFDIILFIPRLIGNLIKNGILGIKSALNAGNLFGKVRPTSIDRVPLQSLFQGRVNSLDAPTFNSLETIDANGEFEYDGTVSFNNSGGAAMCVADGFEHELYSNEMAVDNNTEVNASVQVKYSGLVSSTAPIKLKLAFFNGGIEIQTVELDQIATTDSGGWYELSGEYQIADLDQLVDEVRMVLHVSGDATAGTVWFSDADMNKNFVTGIAPIDWIIDLPESLRGIDEFVQTIIDGFMEAIDGIFGDGTPLNTFFDTIFGWVDDIFVTMGEAADALFQALGLSRIFTKIFGQEEAPGLAETEQAVLDLNGRIVALEGSGTVITHTISGTWTNPTPTEHNLITFICVNGGDGGAKGGSQIVENNKGGRSGGYIQKSFYTDELPATVAMTIGAGGAGFTASGGGPGGSGAVTSFGSLLVGIKGVGAVFKPGGAIPYETGVAPGDGGDGGYMAIFGSADAATRIWEPSTNGKGGPFAPGGAAGFGNLTAEVVGKNGTTAPAGIPSGGGGGGGGSITFQSFQNIGPGGNGGFPGGGGGGGASSSTSDANGGNGGAGCIYEVRQW